MIMRRFDDEDDDDGTAEPVLPRPVSQAGPHRGNHVLGSRPVFAQTDFRLPATPSDLLSDQIVIASDRSPRATS